MCVMSLTLVIYNMSEKKYLYMNDCLLVVILCVKVIGITRALNRHSVFTMFHGSHVIINLLVKSNNNYLNCIT